MNRLAVLLTGFASLGILTAFTPAKAQNIEGDIKYTYEQQCRDGPDEWYLYALYENDKGKTIKTSLAGDEVDRDVPIPGVFDKLDETRKFGTIYEGSENTLQELKKEVQEHKYQVGGHPYTLDFKGKDCTEYWYEDYL